MLLSHESASLTQHCLVGRKFDTAIMRSLVSERFTTRGARVVLFSVVSVCVFVYLTVCSSVYLSTR